MFTNTLRLAPLSFGFFLALLPERPIDAQDPGIVRLALEPRSRLWLEGTSNLHDWKCDASEVTAEITVVGTTEAGPNSVPREIGQVVLRVPVKGIQCQNDRMNQNLWKALRVHEHPAIEFRMTDARLTADSAGADRVAFAVSGELSVAGTTKAIEFEVVGVDAGTGLRVTGATELLMTDYGIKPPTAMLGVLRTGNRIVVGFDLLTSYKELSALLSAGDRTVAAGPGWWR
jgi:hypothetical protein